MSFLLWCLIGFVVFVLLQRTPGWPYARWLGLLCFLAAGPLTWVLCMPDEGEDLFERRER